MVAVEAIAGVAASAERGARRSTITRQDAFAHEVVLAPGWLCAVPAGSAHSVPEI